jgi:hypothetical protein
MFGGEFVFSVSRAFVRSCPVAIARPARYDAFHPRAVAAEIVDPRSRRRAAGALGGEERKPSTREKIRAFLQAHTPPQRQP